MCMTMAVLTKSEAMLQLRLLTAMVMYGFTGGGSPMKQWNIPAAGHGSLVALQYGMCGQGDNWGNETMWQ